MPRRRRGERPEGRGRRPRACLSPQGICVMTEILVGQGTDAVAAAEKQSRQATEETEVVVAARRDPARVALLLIAVVILTAAVTYLGPILKPFLVAVFLYFS